MNKVIFEKAVRDMCAAEYNLGVYEGKAVSVSLAFQMIAQATDRDNKEEIEGCISAALLLLNR